VLAQVVVAKKTSDTVDIIPKSYRLFRNKIIKNDSAMFLDRINFCLFRLDELVS